MKKQDFLVKIEEDETLIGPTHPKAELIGRVFGNCLCASSTEKRKSLKELFQSAKIIKLSPLDPMIERALEESCKNFNAALKRSEESSKISGINSCGKCPSCGSRNYFPLWGGSCDKQCADCKTAYDCINMEGCHE